MMRDRILQFYRYHLAQNEGQTPQLTIEEAGSIEELYTSYKKLGGNAFIDAIMKEIHKWTSSIHLL